MSQENVEEILRAGYEAANKGDFNALLPLLDPDIEFNSLIAEMEGRTYRGHSGARDWWDDVASAMNGLTFELQTIEVFGSTALIKLRVSGTVSEVEVPQTMWHAAREDGGKLVWWHVARSREEALEAAGLSE